VPSAVQARVYVEPAATVLGAEVKLIAAYAWEARRRTARREFLNILILLRAVKLKRIRVDMVLGMGFGVDVDDMQHSSRKECEDQSGCKMKAKMGKSGFALFKMVECGPWGRQDLK
jgi:hypothetical protein